MDYSSQEEDLQFFYAKEEEMMTASDFDVWNDSPASVVERRRKFLQWMEDLAQPIKFESDGASENCSGIFLCFKPSGSFRELLSLNVDGCDVTRWESSSTASSSSSRCCPLKETEKQAISRRDGSPGCALLDIRASSSSYGHVLSRVKVKHCRKQTKELSALYQSQDIKAHNGSISAMKFSGDGKYLASSGEDGIVRVWKVIEDKRSRPPRDCLNPTVNDHSQLKPVLLDEEKPNKTTESFKRTSDSACVVFPPKAFRIMEKPLHEFRGHTGEVLDISWSMDNYLLSASMDKTVRLWQVGCNDCLGVFTHNSYVTSVQFDPVNENYFMSGSVDGKVRIWNVSGCNVVDWVDLKDIISAGGIIGSLSGGCRFFYMSGDYLELDSQIHLLSKKKSSNKRITGFQFLPQDQSKVLVVSADSKVRILQGRDVVRNTKDVFARREASRQCLSRLMGSTLCQLVRTPIYIYGAMERNQILLLPKPKRLDLLNVSPPMHPLQQPGITTQLSRFLHPLAYLMKDLSLDQSPKEARRGQRNLPANPLSSSTMSASHYKFLKSSYQRATNSSLAWGMVIVTGGWDGRIRTFRIRRLACDYSLRKQNQMPLFWQVFGGYGSKEEIQKQVPPDYDPVEDLSRRGQWEIFPSVDIDTGDDKEHIKWRLEMVSTSTVLSDDCGVQSNHGKEWLKVKDVDVTFHRKDPPPWKRYLLDIPFDMKLLTFD
ncbi:hypothetical protein HID58_096194 [Brassica napus]|uniref:Uncharacterized protein n=1 Tax=Brassica napus TaxID=3708 RepID=A0ABQ7X170_BRANA|nr:hypothetical protein HID58_096194 [Brassica napus]